MLTRFSPSPTGYLHIGNARTAVINYLYAKNQNGKCYLRMDNTDFKRSKEEYEKQIIADLAWLGIEFTGFVRQSDRLKIYTDMKEKLIKDGRLYPCFETEEELSLKRKIQLSRGVPPIYDRKALSLSKEEIDALIGSGKKPHYRFLLLDEEISWKDRIKGEITYKARAFSDPILVREDGSPTYTFCSVVDDSEFAVTDIIRGEDHITNTAIQIQIFKAISNHMPRFAHLGLLKTKEGEISKRYGGHDIKSLRKSGVDNMTILSYLAHIGSSMNVSPTINMQDLWQDFSLKRFSAGAIFYDPEDLNKLNHKVVGKYDYNVVAEKLKELSLNIPSEEQYEVIRENLNTYEDVQTWLKIFDDFKINSIVEEEKEFLKICAALLPDDLSSDFFQAWIKEVANETNRKGRELYHPLRIALTGLENGPELKKLIPLLGVNEVKRRFGINA